MITIKNALNLAMIILFISLTSNVFANSMIQNKSQIVLFNLNFEVTIDGNKHTVITPLTPSSSPVTVKIIDNGVVLFESITENSTMVVGDGIDHRVSSNSIEHSRLNNVADHKTLEVSQNGIVLLSKEI